MFSYLVLRLKGRTS